MAILLVFVGLAAWLTWYFGVPRYRPSLRTGEAYGVDVSHHQGRIDWVKVADDGIRFAYIKASEGGDYVDRDFVANAAAARSAGLQVGVYHFFTFCRPGADQASNFLAVVPPEDDLLPPAVDFELGGNCSKPPPPDVVRREFASFMDIVEKEWKRPLLVYVLHNAEARYRLASSTASNPTWQRHLYLRPRNDRWTVWQVSALTHVDGIAGPVDLNVAKPGLLAAQPS